MHEYRKMEKEVQNEEKNGNTDVVDHLEDSKPDSKLSFDEMYQKLFGRLPVKDEEQPKAKLLIY